jgi:hypothetical protein
MGKPKMGKPRHSLDSSPKPGREKSIRSDVSSVVRSDGRKYFESIASSVFTGMQKRGGGPRGAVKCLAEFKNRLVGSRNMVEKLEDPSPSAIASLEDEMEEIVLTVMKPPVSTIACAF